MDEVACPGCGLALPRSERAHYDGYFHNSPECWELFTEVLEKEFSDAVLFGRAHQLSVDAYAVQHAGGAHPDKSVDVHLCGLHLALVRGLPPARVPPLLQRLVAGLDAFPHFEPPTDAPAVTVLDVALADDAAAHAAAARRWAEAVWAAWSPHHDAVAALVQRTLKPAPRA